MERRSVPCFRLISKFTLLRHMFFFLKQSGLPGGRFFAFFFGKSRPRVVWQHTFEQVLFVNLVFWSIKCENIWENVHIIIISHVVVKTKDVLKLRFYLKQTEDWWNDVFIHLFVMLNEFKLKITPGHSLEKMNKERRQTANQFERARTSNISWNRQCLQFTAGSYLFSIKLEYIQFV